MDWFTTSNKNTRHAERCIHDVDKWEIVSNWSVSSKSNEFSMSNTAAMKTKLGVAK